MNTTSIRKAESNFVQNLPKPVLGAAPKAGAGAGAPNKPPPTGAAAGCPPKADPPPI